MEVAVIIKYIHSKFSFAQEILDLDQDKIEKMLLRSDTKRQELLKEYTFIFRDSNNYSEVSNLLQHSYLFSEFIEDNEEYLSINVISHTYLSQINSYFIENEKEIRTILTESYGEITNPKELFNQTMVRFFISYRNIMYKNKSLDKFIIKIKNIESLLDSHLDIIKNYISFKEIDFDYN